MHAQGEFAVIGDEGVLNDGLAAGLDRLAGLRMPESRPPRLHQEGGEQTVLLVKGGKEMIVEENGLERDIGKPAILDCGFPSLASTSGSS